jgi:hypothetical protein
MRPNLFSPLLLLLLILTSCSALDPNSTDFQVENGRLLGKVSLFVDDINHAELCPQCPRYVAVNSDEQPEVTAANYCAKLPSSVKGKDGLGCKEVVAQSVANRQLSLFVEMGLLLDEHLRAESVDMKSVEGKSFTYLDKIRLMQRLVHHQEVETVCEIGFNAGHSALLWLTSGARKVLSFEVRSARAKRAKEVLECASPCDTCQAGHTTTYFPAVPLPSILITQTSSQLGQYAYSTKALSFLNKHYPGRVQVTMGDSLETVPGFHAMWPDERCNLLFVDGGHYYKHAIGDLRNFRPMRNESFHLLLVDDTNQGEVATAWSDYIAAGLAVEREVVWSDYSEGLLWIDKGGPSESLVIDDGSEVPVWRSSIAYGQYK